MTAPDYILYVREDDIVLNSLGQIKFRTHAVDIKQHSDTGRIYCFKFTATRCEFDSFETADAAGDYILEPFPSISYRVNIDDTDCQTDSA